MSDDRAPAVWFPAIRAGTGADVFTERLVAGFRQRGLRAEITWLPLRAEYAPWTVPVPPVPNWANLVQVNTWLHRRFIPRDRPFVATMLHCVHDPAFQSYQSLAQRTYHRFHVKPMERWVLDNAEAVVAISDYTAQRTQEAFGIAKIEVIPPAFDPDGLFRPVEPAPHAAPFRLLFVGNGSRRKGADLLAPIMEQLGTGFELTVVGASSVGGRQLPPNIRVRGRLGSLQELAKAYQHADALLFPTRLEGFGLVAVEAMASGLPVIATRGSSLTEVVEDGVTGVLCRQDDVADFASAARRLAADASLRAGMARAGVERVRREFSLVRMLDAYINLYSGCVNRFRASAPRR